MKKPPPPNLADAAKKYLRTKKQGPAKKQGYSPAKPAPPVGLGNSYSLDFGTKMGAQRPRSTDKGL